MKGIWVAIRSGNWERWDRCENALYEVVGRGMFRILRIAGGVLIYVVNVVQPCLYLDWKVKGS
jgi:hypothetical protein